MEPKRRPGVYTWMPRAATALSPPRRDASRWDSHLPTEELEQIIQTFTRQFQRRLRWKKRASVCLIVLACCSLFMAAHHDRNLASFMRGEIDLFGELRYQPEHGVDQVALASIDFDRIHSELMPQWINLAGRTGMYVNREREAHAFSELEQEVAADPNLSALLSELNLRFAMRQYLRDSQRTHYLLWAWNDYLRRQEVPYWIRGRSNRSRYNAFFAIKTYDVLSRPRVAVGERGYRIGMVRRADDPNVIEPYLGAASRSARGAFVVVDSIHDFVVEEIWALLGATEALPLDPGQRAFATAVREEAVAQLPAWAVEIIVRSAEQRWDLNHAIDSLNTREACTGNRVTGVVLWKGVEPTKAERLQELAQMWEGRRCPAITVAEADELATASRTLQQTAGLPEALSVLAAWMARAITVHEVRHLADSDRVDGRAGLIPCPGCPPEMPTLVRAELSAYLATFAWSEAPHSALYQACRAVEQDFDAHSAALRFILDELFLSCEQPPPADLPTRARALERELFERSDRIALHDDFPEQLELE